MGSSILQSDGSDQQARSSHILATWEWRWFFGSVTVVPVLVAVGVYWLHAQPSGPDGRASDPIIVVRLIQPSKEIAARQPVTVQTVPPIADFHADAPIEPKEAPVAPDSPEIANPPAGAEKSPPAQRKLLSNFGHVALPSTTALTFRRILFAHLERYHKSPIATRRDGLHGTVRVRFSMQRNGSVTDAFVQESSGQTVLDKEALEIIRRAQPLPAIPPDLPDQLSVLFPVEFE
jgi:periplasmic protein TonB